jgi:hypothetical protein
LPMRGPLPAAGLMLALWIAPGGAAQAFDFSLSAYADLRLVGAPKQTSWLAGGLSKFRYGGGGVVHFAEGVAQGTLTVDDHFSLIGVIRAEPVDRDVIDPLEAYASWHSGADTYGVSWSAKAGAFFPTISLENDDLGWTSPYTLTYSAINSWIGEELRTIGAEGTLRYHSDVAGTFSLIGALDCCNDQAGVLVADRGWAMDDRPTGLFERVREPDATMKIFHAPVPARTGLFDEIDHRAGWYGGLNWQMPEIGKLSVLRYENQADPAAFTAHDFAWETKFWSFGARTQMGQLVLIAQQLSGYTAIVSKGVEFPTKFQSAFLLASYDLSGFGLPDWRASLRADLFQTRHIGATPNPMSEDGRALTFDLSWQPADNFRLTGETLLMHSRKGEYAFVGVPKGQLDQSQLQLDAKLFF